MANRRSDAVGADPPPFLRSALQTYSTNVAAAFLSLANVLIVARTLGAEGRGQVAFLTAIAWLTASFSTLGVQEANSNFAASDPRSRRSLATNSILLSLLFGGVTFAVLYGLIAVFPAAAGESDPALRWITFAFLPVIILMTCLRSLVLADYGFSVANAAYLLPSILNAAVNGLFAGTGILSVETAVGVWLAGQTLEALILAAYVARRLAGFGRPDLGLARRTLGFGAKAHVGRVMQLGNYRLDQWLLGAIAGPRELGLYSVAVAWAEALWFLPTALAAVQRPDLVRAKLRRAAREAGRVFRAATLITGVSALVMIAAAPILCVVIFGEEFRGSIDDLRVLVAGAFGMVALKLLGNALVAQGKPVLQSIAIGTGFAFTLGLDIILIPPFGGIGAALASTLAYSVAGIIVAMIFVATLDARASDLLPHGGDVAWFVQKLRRSARRPAAPTTPEETPTAPF